MNKLIYGLIGIVIVAGVIFALSNRTKTDSPASTPTPVPAISTTLTSRAKPTPEPKTIQSSGIAHVASAYNFSLEVPTSWEAEAVPAIEAINFYDPTASGSTNLEKSQVFIRYFNASTFLTLSTVTIYGKENQTITGRPAIRYDIEKEAGVANFANQPSWRNQRHFVTDIRVSDANPSIFYVIAKNPNLSEQTYQQILHSLSLSTSN